MTERDIWFVRATFAFTRGMVSAAIEAGASLDEFDGMLSRDDLVDQFKKHLEKMR